MREFGFDLLRFGDAGVARHGQDDLHRTVRLLRVLEGRYLDDIRTRFRHPVLTGYTDVEEAVLDVGRDLLGSKHCNREDARIVDRCPVGTLGFTPDLEIRRFEQVEGGAL